MKRRKKLLLVLAPLAAFLGWALLHGIPELPQSPQYLTYPDGTTYRFGGVTWGTTHNAPLSLATRLAARLPRRLADMVWGKYGGNWTLVPPVQTPSPELMVWMEIVTNPPPGIIPAESPQAVLADQDGREQGLPVYLGGGPAKYRVPAVASYVRALTNWTSSTQILYLASSSATYIAPSNAWQRVSFSIVPRRSRMLEVHFYGGTWALAGDGERVRSIRFRNPLYGNYPQWKSEALPSVKTAGDLKAGLTGCSYVNSGIQCVLDLKSSRGVNEWLIETAELSDATGNRISSERPDGLPENNRLTFPGWFWPGENALRLKVFLKRALAYVPTEDFVTFTNVPLPAPFATSGTTLTKKVKGSSVQLRNFGYPQQISTSGSSASAMGSHQLVVALPEHPEGWVVDFASVTTDAGNPSWYKNHRSSQSEVLRTFDAIPANAKYLNVTVAVQKMQVVEFYVKPVESDARR